MPDTELTTPEKQLLTNALSDYKCEARNELGRAEGENDIYTASGNARDLLDSDALAERLGLGRWGYSPEPDAERQRLTAHYAPPENRTEPSPIQEETPAFTNPPAHVDYAGREAVWRVLPGNPTCGALPHLGLLDRVSGETLAEVRTGTAVVAGGKDFEERRTEVRVSVFENEQDTLSALRQHGGFRDITEQYAPYAERFGIVGQPALHERVFVVTDPDLAKRWRALREASSVVSSHDQPFTAVYVYQPLREEGPEYQRIALLENRPDVRTPSGVSVADALIAALRQGGASVYTQGVTGPDCALALGKEEVDEEVAQMGVSMDEPTASQPGV